MALTIIDLEYTLDKGVTWQSCTAAMDNGDGSVTVPVGNANRAVGDVGIRAKATAWATAGPVTWNTVPFTAVASATVLRPVADDSNVGWTTAPLWSKLNVESEAAFISCAANANAEVYEVMGPDPAERPSRVWVRVRARKTAAGGNERTLTTDWYDMNGFLGGWSHTLNEVWTTYSFEVTTAIPATVVETAVYLKTGGTLSADANGRGVEVAWVKLEYEYDGGGGGGTGNGSTNTPNATVVHRSTFDGATPFAPHGRLQWEVQAPAGRVTQSTTVTRNGSPVARVELHASDPEVAGGTRSEFAFVPGNSREEWYGFSLYLPSTHYGPGKYDSYPECLTQWHHTDGQGSPAILLYAHNTQLRLKIAYSTQAGSVQPVGEIQPVLFDPMPVDQWLDFVFHIRHAHGGQSDGFTRCWVNGEQKVNHAGPNAWNKPLESLFWKAGIYKWNWNGSGTTDVSARMLYMDEVRIGTAASSYDQIVAWDGGSGGGGGGTAVLQMDTTDPTSLTGWENNVAMTNSDAVGGVITVQNRRFRSLNSDLAALDFGEGACSGVTQITIENCDFYGAGFMIKSWYNNNKVTIRNCRFWGAPVTAWTSYKKTRRAVKVNGVKELVVENCFMKGTAGISVDTTGLDIDLLRVRYNVALNIDGRVEGSFEHSQFLQVVGKGRVCSDGEVGWNYVLNEPNRSWVEDNINLYNIGGLSSKRLRVHHNFIKGAFYDPYDTVSPYYSGGGIICDSSNAEGHGQVDTCTRYVDVEDNYVVGSNNYSLSVATGRDIAMRRNTVICKGYLDADDVARIGGTGRLTGDPSGINVRDFYAPGVISNIVVDANKVGVFKWDAGTSQYVRRTGYFSDAGVAETGRVNIPDPVNEAAEDALLTEWLNAAAAAGVTLGKQS